MHASVIHLMFIMVGLSKGSNFVDRLCMHGCLHMAHYLMQVLTNITLHTVPLLKVDHHIHTQHII